MSTDLARWFDDGIWETADRSAGHRFTHAVPPGELLSDAPPAIWPALMPCDLLPILGNDRGDWLCVRFGNDNSASEIVHWYHGGGDWIPWGRTLAEAIVFDALRIHLPGKHRDHAESAEGELDDAAHSDPILIDWAIACFSGTVASDLRSAVDAKLKATTLADLLLKHQISVVAVLCQFVIAALENPLLPDDLTGQWAENNAQQTQRVLFDNRLLTESQLDSVSQIQRVDSNAILAEQDWDAAIEFSSQATSTAPELAWTWDILGYGHERAGRTEAAVQAYRQGLRCSIFTDQTVRMRTHGFTGEGQKFSASRLLAMNYESDQPAEREYLALMALDSADERREKVQHYFSQLALAAPADSAQALWVRAGWDVGAEPMTAFSELLEHVSAAAQSSGRVAVAELAKTHRECFRSRYGI